MTQSVLFATPDSDIAPATEDAAIQPADARDRKDEEQQRGDIAEWLFCIAARERGYRVRHLGGGCKGYDVILERDGLRPMFVQVKHTLLRTNDGSRFYRISNNVAGKTYDLSAYDILAVYMWDRGDWVFFTRSELGDRGSTSYTPPELRMRQARSHACDNRAPNNWELLDALTASLCA